MIKKSDAIAVKEAHNLRGGVGRIEMKHFYDEAEFNGLGRLYGLLVVPPGCSVGDHSHIGEQESYYILEGVATYNDNGKEVKLYPGDMALCPDGEFHGVKNEGEVDLKFIALISNTK